MKCQISNQIAPVHKVDYNSSKMKGSKPLTKRKCYYTGARYVFFMSDPFLTGPQFIQPATSPTVFTFLSHSASCLPHAVSRLPDDDAAARRPDAAARLLDAADHLTPSLPAFLPHGPARPAPVLVLPSLLHPLAFLLKRSRCPRGG